VVLDDAALRRAGGGTDRRKTRGQHAGPIPATGGREERQSAGDG
jgi:hypothetical protein